MKKEVLIITVGLMASGLCASAQDEGGMPPPPNGEASHDGGSMGGPGQGNRPPRPPLDAVLDANGDGVIDADEIANAAAVLKKLDKNGDGKLTPDEYRPVRPPRRDGQSAGNNDRQGGGTDR